MKFKSETQVAEYFIKNIKKYGFRQSASQHKEDCQRWLKWLENLFNEYQKSYGCYFKDDKFYEIETNEEVEQSVEDKLYIKKIQDLKTAIKLYEQVGI